MEARVPYDFEHAALVPGPGNAGHFPLASTTWRKVKGGKQENVCSLTRQEFPIRFRRRKFDENSFPISIEIP